MKPETLLGHLHAVAVLADVDVSGIECRHAMIRKLLDQRGMTWSPELELVSADFLCRQVSFELRKAASQKILQKPRRNARKKKKTCGGGAQRAFFSEMLRGVQVWKLTPTRRRALFRRLNADFKRLGPEQRQRFQDVGLEAAISRRAGGAPFPRCTGCGENGYILFVIG